MKQLILIIFLLLALTNCSSTNVGSSSANMRADNVAKSGSSASTGTSDALHMADKECKKYNRRAIYVPDNSPDGQGSYQCVN